METNDISLGIVGSGGDGVVAAGEILTSFAASAGLSCIMVKSFGPQIRGGESSCRLRMSGEKIFSNGSGLRVLVCLNWMDYQRFSGELEVEDDVIILMDEDDDIASDNIPVEGGKRRSVYTIPFASLSKEAKNPKGKNMIVLGLLAESLGLPVDQIEKSIKKKFKKKKATVAEANLTSFKVGREYAKSNLSKIDLKFKYKEAKPKYLITGDEAVAFGALAAGCRFYSSYPITPASEIMEWLGKELPKFGGAVVQAEDEISAMCMVTGASYGGVKSMTATSGPGLSLKLEAIGLGCMAELPYVVVDVQRGGPSTGMPTKSEQGDLNQAIYGLHGDAPHAVMAASDVEDCFRATIEAFNVAEAYQMPVILLTDQILGHRKETVRELNFEDVHIVDRLRPRQLSKGKYERFLDTPDGVSPMTWPGIENGQYLCSGIEHEESGAPTASYGVHEKMSEKRNKKLVDLENCFKYIRRYGDRTPKVGVLAWGSNKGIVREAVDYFVDNRDASVGSIVPQLLYPLQKDIFKQFLASVEVLIVVENSFTGQFLNYLKTQLDLPEKILHLKSAGGKIFSVRDLTAEIDKALSQIGE